MGDLGLDGLHNISGYKCDLCGELCDPQNQELNALTCTYANCPAEASCYHQDCLERYLKSIRLEKNRKTGFKCPRGSWKASVYCDAPCPGKIDKSHPIHIRNDNAKKRRKAKQPDMPVIQPKFGPAAKAKGKEEEARKAKEKEEKRKADQKLAASTQAAAQAKAKPQPTPAAHLAAQVAALRKTISSGGPAKAKIGVPKAKAHKEDTYAVGEGSRPAMTKASIPVSAWARGGTLPANKQQQQSVKPPPPPKIASTTDFPPPQPEVRRVERQSEKTEHQRQEHRKAGAVEFSSWKGLGDSKKPTDQLADANGFPASKHQPILQDPEDVSDRQPGSDAELALTRAQRKNAKRAARKAAKQRCEPVPEVPTDDGISAAEEMQACQTEAGSGEVEEEAHPLRACIPALASYKAQYLVHQLEYELGFSHCCCLAAVQRWGSDLEAGVAWLLEGGAGGERQAAEYLQTLGDQMPDVDVSEELRQLEQHQGWLGLPADDIVDAVTESMGCVHTAVSLLYEREEGEPNPNGPSAADAGFAQEVGMALGDVAWDIGNALLQNSFALPVLSAGQYSYGQFEMPAGAVGKDERSPDVRAGGVQQPVTPSLAARRPSATQGSPTLLQGPGATYAAYGAPLGLLLGAQPAASNAVVDSLFSTNTYMERYQLLATAVGISGPSSCLTADGSAELPQLLEQLYQGDTMRQQALPSGNPGQWGGPNGTVQQGSVWPATPAQQVQRRSGVAEGADVPEAALVAAASVACEADHSSPVNLAEDRDLDTIMATLMCR